ncbi:MAG TPA: hypothetical protein VGQ71_08485, partial [Terriglobales bacterium]|nr:hypothetical protein [Terriglobales bacterium]
LPTLDLTRYAYISVHLPSAIEPEFEPVMFGLLNALPAHWLLITHPDVIHAPHRWAELRERLCIENMDKRKSIGQTARDLGRLFESFPEATFCFDIGHAHQVDPTMGESVLILEEFGSKLRQVHVSEVNSESKHDPVSLEALRAFQSVADLIPEGTPLILESRVPGEAAQAEMDIALQALRPQALVRMAGD